MAFGLIASMINLPLKKLYLRIEVSNPNIEALYLSLRPRYLMFYLLKLTLGLSEFGV